MSFTTELTRQQIFMEVLRSDVVRRLGTGVKLEASAYIDLANEMHIDLTAHVLAEKLVEETQTAVFFYRRPYGPWQAFKEKYLGIKPPMKCAKREVTFKRYKTAPESTQPWPESFGRPVLVEMVDFSGGVDEYTS